MFRALPGEERRRRLELLDEEAAEALLFDWSYWQRPSQATPPGYDWDFWLVKAGRGFGKTRVGAEWVRQRAKASPLVNLIGATGSDARDIMIQGESGIMAICPRGERPVYQPSKARLRWPTGAISLIFTADEPERLRGKQHYALWCDELAAWRYEESWDQAQFGLRLGLHPQAVITSTPKPTKVIKELIANPKCVVTHGRTHDNRHNLAPAFVNSIIKKYEGTRLGRQELYAEVLTDNPNALWTHKLIDAARITLAQYKALSVARVVVAVDPAVSANEDSNETGIVTVSRDFGDPAHFYILADDSGMYSPDQWAKKVVSAAKINGADRTVGEVNNGGDLVEANIRHTDENISYRAVHASRGKARRAEPISALYEQGRVHHVGGFGVLEDQMCDFDPLLPPIPSPDRMDALVWGVTELSGAEETEHVIVHEEKVESISDDLDQLDFMVAQGY